MKEPGEVGRALEADLIGDLRNRPGLLLQELRRALQPHHPDDAAGARGAALGATDRDGFGDRLSGRLQEPGPLLPALSSGLWRIAFAILG